MALCVSGGKDSMAMLHHMLPLADMFTVYYMNPGDADPYTLELMYYVSSIVPSFTMVVGDVLRDRAINGHPSDVVPMTMTPLLQLGSPDVPKVFVRPTMECCYKNQMLPLYERLIADGVTMIARGQKGADHLKNQQVFDGYVDDNNIEHLHPIEDETDESIFAYLRNTAPDLLHRWYDDNGSQGSIDCLSCTGWWDEIGEGYLEKHYPEVLANRRAVRQLVKDESISVLKWVC